MTMLQRKRYELRTMYTQHCRCEDCSYIQHVYHQAQCEFLPLHISGLLHNQPSNPYCRGPPYTGREAMGEARYLLLISRLSGESVSIVSDLLWKAFLDVANQTMKLPRFLRRLSHTNAVEIWPPKPPCFICMRYAWLGLVYIHSLWDR